MTLKVKKTQIITHIPDSLNKELHKYMFNRSENGNIHGMKKAIVIQAIYEYLLKNNWKISAKIKKDIELSTKKI